MPVLRQENAAAGSRKFRIDRDQGIHRCTGGQDSVNRHTACTGSRDPKLDESGRTHRIGFAALYQAGCPLPGDILFSDPESKRDGFDFTVKPYAGCALSCSRGYAAFFPRNRSVSTRCTGYPAGTGALAGPAGQGRTAGKTNAQSARNQEHSLPTGISERLHEHDCDCGCRGSTQDP